MLHGRGTNIASQIRLNGEEPLVKAVNLTKWFPVRGSILGRRRGSLWAKAVDGVSFHINRGEILGLVGESGCGKTTTGRLLCALTLPTSGAVLIRGANLFALTPRELQSYRRSVQIIFQDPYESLDPRKSVEETVSEPIRIHNISKNPKEEKEIVMRALTQVRLVPPEEFMRRYPHELSGGQRQRVAVARALTTGPAFLVADEPVSMLDVSIRAEVLNLLVELRDQLGIAILFITHDMSVARHICDRIAIMYLGRIAEMGPAEEVIFNPLHPYSKALLGAVPIPDPSARRSQATISGEVPSPIAPPSGCRFHPRCPSYIGDICKNIDPSLVESRKNHIVACHLYPVEAAKPEVSIQHEGR